MVKTLAFLDDPRPVPAQPAGAVPVGGQVAPADIAAAELADMADLMRRTATAGQPGQPSRGGRNEQDGPTAGWPGPGRRGAVGALGLPDLARDAAVRERHPALPAHDDAGPRRHHGRGDHDEEGAGAVATHVRHRPLGDPDRVHRHRPDPREPGPHHRRRPQRGRGRRLAMLDSSAVLGLGGLVLFGVGALLLAGCVGQDDVAGVQAFLGLAVVLLAAAPWLPYIDGNLFPWLHRTLIRWLRDTVLPRADAHFCPGCSRTSGSGRWSSWSVLLGRSRSGDLVHARRLLPPARSRSSRAWPRLAQRVKPVKVTSGKTTESPVHRGARAALTEQPTEKAQEPV